LTKWTITPVETRFIASPYPTKHYKIKYLPTKHYKIKYLPINHYKIKHLPINHYKIKHLPINHYKIKTIQQTIIDKIKKIKRKWLLFPKLCCY